jgi:hypothetical protein
MLIQELIRLHGLGLLLAVTMRFRFFPCPEHIFYFLPKSAKLNIIVVGY